MDSFTGAPKEDDGLDHVPDSLQIESGKAVVLSWKVSNAPDGVELTDPAQSGAQKFDSSTSSTEVTPQQDTQDYSLVAVAGDQRSDPKSVHVSTHPAGHFYSPHAAVLPPEQPPQVNYFRILAQGGEVASATDSLTAAPGATVTLAWEVEGDVAKVEIDNGVGDVTDKTASSGDVSGEGTVDVTLPAGTDPVTYTITLTPEDQQFQPITQQVTATLQTPSTTTTAAPSTTTTAAPSTTTTAAPSTTTTAAPSTTTTAAAQAVLEVIDKKGDVVTFVRVGLFDEGFDETTKTADKLQNGPTDDKNFIGRDTRSFRFRLKDPKNTAKTAELTWKTVFDGGPDKDKDDDTGGDGKLTLVPQGNGVFLSNAVMIVSHPKDKVEADSGLTEGPDKGMRKPGESNHRQRLITVDNDHPLASQVVAKFKPASGKEVSAQVPVFSRSPEGRLRLQVHLVNVKDGSGTAIAPDSRLNDASTLIQRIYASIGIFVEVQKHEIDAPKSCLGWPARLAATKDPNIKDPSVEDGHRDGAGKVLLSPSEADLFAAVRKMAGFDAHDAYLLYVHRIFPHPLPTKTPFAGEPGGVSFPESILAAASSAASGMTIVAAGGGDVLADMHEFTHDIGNGPNGKDSLGRSTFHFWISKKDPAPATANANAAPIDNRNVMKGFFLTYAGFGTSPLSGDDVFMPRRIWDSMTRDGVTVPSQIDIIRTYAGGNAKRFLRDY